MIADIRRGRKAIASRLLSLIIILACTYLAVIVGMTGDVFRTPPDEQTNPERKIASFAQRRMLAVDDTTDEMLTKKTEATTWAESSTAAPMALFDVSNTNPQETFAACLVVKDDNYRLREWLAYHYHVLPLRHVVVAVDPLSKESPSEIFQDFRDQLNMSIHEWTDRDFGYQPNLHTTNPDKIRKIHLERQHQFLEKCMTFLYHFKHKWTLMTDTDEFLTVDPYSQSNVTFPNVTRRLDFEKPGSVMEFIDTAEEREVFNASCIVAPRVLFGATDKPEYTDQSVVPEGLEVDPFRLDTFRWREHNQIVDKLNGLGKPMMDVSKLRPLLPVKVHDLHRPVPSMCGSALVQQTMFSSPFRVNHYLGSWEEYSYRDDARKRAERSREAWEYRSKLNSMKDKRTHLWLRGFVKSVGLKKANFILKGTGLPRDFKKEPTRDWEVDLNKELFKEDESQYDFVNYVINKRDGGFDEDDGGGGVLAQFVNNMKDETETGENIAMETGVEEQ